jgi:hypothetical protein
MTQTELRPARLVKRDSRQQEGSPCSSSRVANRLLGHSAGGVVACLYEPAAARRCWLRVKFLGCASRRGHGSGSCYSRAPCRAGARVHPHAAFGDRGISPTKVLVEYELRT